MRDRDYNILAIRYVVPYVERYSIVLYCRLYVMYMLFICRYPKYMRTSTAAATTTTTKAAVATAVATTTTTTTGVIRLPVCS